ncbi:MAG: ATP-dependent RecD-like DNA helicase [Eubacteriales bacterium]
MNDSDFYDDSADSGAYRNDLADESAAQDNLSLRGGDDTDTRRDDLVEVEGVVDRIVYHNDDNGYTVCDFAVAEEELITLVGIMPFVGEGETIKAMGKWEVHQSYGRQFHIEAYEKQLPATSGAILRYLKSKAVKGIGPTTAGKLVEKYGEESFDVIENHPEWLAELPGISEKKALEISENFKLQFGVRTVMMFCRDFVGPATAVRIYKKWGGGAVDIIKDDPYVLCDEFYGIGFERADRIAKSVGLEQNDQRRIMGGLRYILSFNGMQNGHTFVPEDKLIPAAVTLLGVSRDEADDALEGLIGRGRAVRVKLDRRSCIYLDTMYAAEKYIADKLTQLDRLCPAIDVADIERFIAQMEEEGGMKYAVMQKRAIVSALNSGVMILTGGPGTGKTTVIRAVIRVFERMGHEIALAAPTGRAAKRMSEATQCEAKTIHRLLEMEYADEREPRFNRNEKNQLEEEVIIIDEASMVDTVLLNGLLRAIKPGARLILIGDSDQLPSVGAGNVLCDLIASDRFSTVKLKEIFRQAKESLIVTNAHAINEGEEPTLDSTDNDFFFLTRNREENIAPTIADLCVSRLPKSYGEDIREKIQVITPSRKGVAGTEMLNSLLQRTLNPPSPKKKEKKVREIIFREGDKVMQIKNNYDIPWEKEGTDGGSGVFNGDIGVIRKISPADESVTIAFDDRVAEYDFAMLGELDHAYAITVHKSQGSEYPVVIMPVYSYSPRLLTRNLLYTAVTRAQKMVIMVGRRDVLHAMIDNNRQTLRYTGLAWLLGELNNQ